MRLFILVGCTVLFLNVMINLFVTLVIYIAQDQHVPDYVKIYEVFQSDRYQNIRDKIMRSNYTILIGDDQTGLKNFIQHQANIHSAEGRPVVIKRYHSAGKHKQKLIKTLKQTRFYMELVLGLDRNERTQVFFVKNLNQLPLEQIKFIREKYPSDNIIIACQDDLSIRLAGFKTIKFPGVTLRQLKKMMQVYYDLTAKQADKVIRDNYDSIQMIFDYFKRKSKIEEGIVEQLVEVQDIEELNEISHDLAQKSLKKLQKNKNKSKDNKQKGKKGMMQ